MPVDYTVKSIYVRVHHQTDRKSLIDGYTVVVFERKPTDMIMNRLR